MGLFSFARDGRVIAASLSIGSVVLLVGIRKMLEHIREQNEIKTTPPKPRYITQETEDSLKLNTLESLLGHYNFAIRETAAKIICDRALNETESVDYLLWGITRPDYEERMKSLRTLALITDQNSLHILHTDKAYSALVRSLELCAEESPRRKLDDKYYDDYYLRDMSEKFCLMFIIQLLNKYDPEKLVKAKFIDKWLVKQRWGDTDEERQHNFSQYMSHRHNRICEICRRIRDTRGGYEALQRARLIATDGDGELEAMEEAGEINGIRIVLSITGEGVDLREVESFQPRVLEQSVEEQRLRRQHREAMVLNDGTRPLGRGDIIERGHD
ncbi:hypothetical protein RB594_007253 [Gaeumannomyces avenae]